MNKIGVDIRMIHNTGIGTYVRGIVEGLNNTGLIEKKGLCLFGSLEENSFSKDISQKSFAAPIYSVREQFE